MKRYIGEIFWMKIEEKSGIHQGSSNSKIQRAILNNNIFKIDHKNPGSLPDSEIRLRSKDGFKFDGSAKYVDDLKSSAIVNFEYYLNNKKAILVGTWEEEKLQFICIVRLDEVQSFEN